MDQVDLIRLCHMRDAAAEVLKFVAGKTRSDLDQDRMLTFAVLLRANEASTFPFSPPLGPSSHLTMSIALVAV